MNWNQRSFTCLVRQGLPLAFFVGLDCDYVPSDLGVKRFSILNQVVPSQLFLEASRSTILATILSSSSSFFFFSFGTRARGGDSEENALEKELLEVKQDTEPDDERTNEGLKQRGRHLATLAK